MPAKPADRRVIVLDVVGLQPDHVTAERMPNLASLVWTNGTVASLQPAVPALTVPAQTTLATGALPRTHGDVASGEYDRQRQSVAFWERDRDGRQRIWETASESGLTTAALCFQHLVGTTADVAVTPAPIEDDDDQLVEMDCWTNPDGFYDALCEQLGHFPLHRYWGPGANEASSQWILDAAGIAVQRFDPDLAWVYVPHLDYVGLAEGPDDEAFATALETVDALVGEFLATLRQDDRWGDTAVLVCSEYGFQAVDRVGFPNRALRNAGLLSVADDGTVDLADSAAFAMVDHQIAHVYVDDDVRTTAVTALGDLETVDTVLDTQGKADYGIDHPNAGELVLVADSDAWFQYYWWTDPADAPPYATDMDIHKKPGFDPCELFPGERGPVSLDPTQVGGSHGRVDPETTGVFALGGPAQPPLSPTDPVDARSVAPTVAALLGRPTTVEPTAKDASLLGK